MRNHTLAAIAVLLTVSPSLAQRFELVETRVPIPLAGQEPRIHAIADLNGDGRDDLLVSAPKEVNVEAEERFERTPLYEYAGLRNGRFRRAPLVRGTIRARTPVVAVDDFNGDGQPRGGHVRSHALAHAVRRQHRRDPPYTLSGHRLTDAYAWFLAGWAKRLSWQERSPARRDRT